MLQQFSLKVGVKKYGNRGEAAVTNKLTQLHDIETYIPMEPDEMTPQQKSEALNSLIFLTEKRDGCVKWCRCC